LQIEHNIKSSGDGFIDSRSQVFRFLFGKIPGDLTSATSYRLMEYWRGHELAINDNGQPFPDVLARDFRK
jgi:hypothetical protein